jgi:hypothetical protein
MEARGRTGVALAVLVGWVGVAPGGQGASPEPGAAFRAGAAAVDVSPSKLPVIVNGGFLEAKADAVIDPLRAKALVLDDGTTRLAIVVVDSCMMPRELIDRAKAIAAGRTAIPADRMLVSATHTHSAPAAMGALGARADPDYVATLPGRIAEAIARAEAKLAPAQVGWAVVDDPDHTHCRRWIRRPDRLLTDPFGDATARANMHPGYENPDVIGPSGPVDPALSVLSVRSADGRPLSVLANYSMHYFGAPAVSADYYGAFSDRLAERIAPAKGGEPCVVLMSQGTSGDQHWMDYGRPKDPITLDDYSRAVAERAVQALRNIEYRPRASLAMAEARLTLMRRVPDEKRMAWARPIAAAMGDRVPRNLAEVYALEAIHLHDEPGRELKLQAIRVGDLGIAAIPDEVYAITGLKLKARSPLTPTIVFGLANGSEGYIPPPEQHALGGYTTWPARTAALEVRAEPKIVEALLGLLETVAGRPRRSTVEPGGAYADVVLASKPTAYWRLGEMEGPSAVDATGHGHSATFEGPLAFYLDGPPSPDFSGPKAVNRAVHLVGGHMAVTLPDPGARASVEFWFWNGLPNAARDVTGVLVSVVDEADPASAGDRLEIGGTGSSPGRLAYFRGGTAAPVFTGPTEVAPKAWHHVAVVLDGEVVSLFLDGKPEASGRAPRPPARGRIRLRIGAGPGPEPTLEGKVDEVAHFDRALSPEEVAEHHRKSSPAPGAKAQ